MDKLVDLVINQDHVAQGWLKFEMTLQAGLIVSLSYLLSLSSAENLRNFGCLIPAIGVISTIFLTVVCIHERKWQAFYMHRYHEVIGNPTLGCFPKDSYTSNAISRQKIDRIGWSIIALNAAITIVWLYVMYYVFNHY